MPNLSNSERRNIILKLKHQIEIEIGEKVRIEDSPKGRQGSRLYVNISKKGVKSLEVICNKEGSLFMGVAISNKKDSETSKLIISIMELGGYKLLKTQTNPRFEYSLETFVDAYQFLNNHTDLEDVESSRLSKKLYDYEFDTLKIAQRYAFALENKDQLMLDLCRQLLDADKFDDAIKVNQSSSERTYREHVVPCVLIHNKVIDLLLNECDVEKVENFIKTHLKIAYISTQEAHRLDYEIGLRTSMPEGWTWGDDILARLKVANIELEQVL